MAPQDENSLDKSFTGSQYDSSLEVPAARVTSLSGSGFGKRSLTPFGFNRMAFTITGIALACIFAIGVISFLIASYQGSKNNQSSGPKPDNYAVKSLQTGGVKQNNAQLKVGEVTQLQVNGNLQVSKTIVLSPTVAPTSATAGQIYYDQATNTPYYYNGTAYVSLAPQHVTSVGGSAGVINVGGGLTVVNNTISNAGVTRLQGATGDVNFVAGSGINVSGTTITNTGVLSVSGTPGQIGVVNNSGNLQLSLTGIQSGGVIVGTTGNSLATVQPTSPGQCLISDQTTGLPVFGSCTGHTTIDSVAVQNGSGPVSSPALTGALVLQGGTNISLSVNGNTVKIDNTAAIGGDVSYGTGSGATHNGNTLAALDSSGKVIDSVLKTQTGGLQVAGSAYFLDLATAGTSTLTVKNSDTTLGNQVANLSITGTLEAINGLIKKSGSTTDTYTLPSNSGKGGVICYVYTDPNTNAISSNCPSGGNVSYGSGSGATHNGNTLAALDSSGNVVDSVIATQNGGLQVAASGYYLDLFNSADSTFTFKNTTTGKAAYLHVTGGVQADKGLSGDGTDYFKLPTSVGHGGTICYVYQDPNTNAISSNCPSGGNVSYGTGSGATHNGNTLAALDSGGNVIDSVIATQNGGLQVTAPTYYLNLNDANDSQLTIKNTTTGKAANLVVTGTVTATKGLVGATGTDTFTVPTGVGHGGVLCYVYTDPNTNAISSNCPSGGNVSYGTGSGATHNGNTLAALDSGGNVIDSELGILTHGVQYTATSSYTIDLKKNTTSTLYVTNSDTSSGSQLANLSVSGQVSAGNGVVTHSISDNTASGNGALGSASDLQVTSDHNNILFTIHDPSDNTKIYRFTFAKSGGSGVQTICTTGISCASGGGQAVILEPVTTDINNNTVGNPQTVSNNVDAIWLQKSSASQGNIIRLQSDINGSYQDALAVDHNGIVTLGQAGTGSANTGLTGTLSFLNSFNSNAIKLQAPAASDTTAYTLKLPKALPSSGSACLMSDNSGQLQFSTCLTGGGAGGGVTQLTVPDASDTTHSINLSGGLTLSSTTLSIKGTAGSPSGGTITIDVSTGGSTGAYINGGNAFGTLTNNLATIGTTDANDLAIITGNTQRLLVDRSNNLSFLQAGTLKVAAATSGAGNQLTVAGGAAGGAGNNNGGNLMLQGGAATGSGTSGGVVVKNPANSAAAFQVQNTNSKSVATVDTTNGQLILGDKSATNGVDGKLAFYNHNSNSIVTLQSSFVGGTYSNLALSLPDDPQDKDKTTGTDTICLQNLGNCAASASNFISNGTGLQTNAYFHIQGDSTKSPQKPTAVLTAYTGQTTNLLELRASDDSTVVASFDAAGNLIAKGGTFGSNGVTNNGSTVFGSVAISNKAAGGVIGTAAATVDVSTNFSVNQTTASQTLSLPTPTTTTAGRVAFVVNVGTTPFTMHGVSIANGAAQTYIWNGSSWIPTNIDTAGVTTVGNFGSSSSSTGATISGNSITLTPADGTNPGAVTAGTQTIGGVKTFSGDDGTPNHVGVIVNNGLVLGSTATTELDKLGITAGAGYTIQAANNSNITLTTGGTGNIYANGSHLYVGTNSATTALDLTTTGLVAPGNLTLQGGNNATNADVTLTSKGTGVIYANGPHLYVGSASSSTALDVTTTGISAVGAFQVKAGGTGNALTIGDTGHTLTLQGSTSTTITVPSGTNTTSIGFYASAALPSGNVTYRFDQHVKNGTGGTYDICTTDGNCTGSSGGGIASSATVNNIPVMSGQYSVINSLLSQNGDGNGAGATMVTVGGQLKVKSANSAAFQVTDGQVTPQDYFTVNGGTGSNVKIGNSDNSNTTLLILDSTNTANAPTCTGNSGGMYYDTTLNQFRLCENGAVRSLSSTLQQAYDATSPSTGPFADVTLSSTNGGLRIKDKASGGLGTDLFSVTDNAGTSKYLQVSANGWSSNLATLNLQTTANSGILNLDAGTAGVNAGTIQVGTVNAGTIQIGAATGAATQTINIGNNNNGSSNIALQLGTLLGTGIANLYSGTGGTVIKSNGQITVSGTTQTTINSFTNGTTWIEGGHNSAGTDKAGGLLVLAGGQSTGAANGGDISLRVSPGGVSGTSANALTEVLNISGATGAATFRPAASSSGSPISFQVQDAGGSALLSADAFNSKVLFGTENVTIAPSALTSPTISSVTTTNSGGTLSGSTSSGKYYYKVNAVTAKGESVTASESSVSVTPIANPTGAPTASTATNACTSSGFFTLTNTYYVTYTTANGETAVGPASSGYSAGIATNTLTVTVGAAPGSSGITGINLYKAQASFGTAYYLAAQFTASGGTFTDTCGTVSLRTVSGLPSSNNAYNNLNKNTVTFSSVTGATSYKIYRSTLSGQEVYIASTASSPYVDSGAAATTTLYPGAASDTRLGVGTLTPSATLDVLGNVNIKPAIDTQQVFTVQNAAGTSLLSLDSSTSKLTVSQASQVIVGLNTVSGITVAAGANTGGSLTGYYGSTYYYRVTGINANGESVGSAEASINGSQFTKLTPPSSGMAGSATAGTGLSIGTYKYEIVYASTYGSTTPGPEITVTTSSGNQKVNLSSIPAGPTGTGAIAVYRTAVGGASGTEKLVTTFSNGTTSYTDSTPDGSLGSAVPTTNSATTATNNAVISFNTIPGATSYRIYRGTSPSAENVYFTTASSPFTDTGSGGTIANVTDHDTTSMLGVGTSAPTASLHVAGTALFKSVVPSANAFQVQDANGNNLISANTLTNQISLTGTTQQTGQLTITGFAAPTGVTVTPTGTTGTTTYSYVVTALNANNGESLASSTVTTTTGYATLDTVNYNAISWTPVAGAKSYRVYRTASTGTPSNVGFIGNVSAATTFADYGIIANTSVTPPVNDGTGGLSVIAQGASAALLGADTSANKVSISGDGTSLFAISHPLNGSILNIDSNTGNLVKNGSFENGNVYWSGMTSTASTGAPNGSYIGVMSTMSTTTSGSSSTATANLTSNLTTGATYTLSFYAGINGDAGALSVTVAGATATCFPTTQLSYGMSLYSCTVTITSTPGTYNTITFTESSVNYSCVFFCNGYQGVSLDSVRLETGSTRNIYRQAGITLNGTVMSNFAIANSSSSALTVANSSGTTALTVDTTSSTVTMYNAKVTSNLSVVNSAGVYAQSVNTNNVANYASLLQYGGGTIKGTQTPSSIFSVAACSTSGTTSYTYAITAVSANGESLPMYLSGTCASTLNSTNYITLSMTYASYGASSYNVYRTASAGSPSTLGKIGTIPATSLSFVDNGLTATTSQQPPTFDTTLLNINVQSQLSVLGSNALQVNSNSGQVINLDTQSNNLVRNGSFEIDNTDWTSTGRNGPTSSPHGSYYGSLNNMNTTTTGTSYSSTANLTTNLTPGSTYTLSFYAANANTNYASIGATVSGATTTCLSSATPTYVWTYYTCTVTITATAGTYGTVTFTETSQNSGCIFSCSTTEQIFIDAVKLESGSSATTYKNGAITLSAPITSSVQLQNSTYYNASTAGQLYISGNPPTLVGANSGQNTSYGIAMSGHYAFLVPYANTGSPANGIQVFDVSNPASPTQLTTGSNNVSTPLFTGNKRIKISGKYAYIAGYNSSGATGVLQIWDISNPYSISAVGSVNYTGGNNTPALYVQGRYAYVGDSGTQTLSVIDVSNPASPAVVSTLGSSGNFGASTVGAIDMYAQGRYLYVANGGVTKPFQIIDISNPLSPTVVSSTAANGTGSSSAPTSIAVQGRYAYIGTANGSIYTVDVSNPAALGTATPVAMNGTSGLTTNSLITQGRYLYAGVASGTSGGKIYTIDIGTPGNPVIFSTAANALAPEAMIATGRYLYVANNNSISMLQIFDLGGEYAQQFEAGGIETDTLNTRGNATFSGDAGVQGQLTVGGGLQVTGSSSFTNNSLSTGDVLNVSSSSSSLTSGNLLVLNEAPTYTSGVSNSGSLLNASRNVSVNSSGITQDGTTAVGTSGSSQLSVTVTDHGDNKRLLIAYSSCGLTPSFNGANFTPISGTGSSICMYYLKNPSIGTYNITGLSGLTWANFATSWYNVDQTNPVDSGNNSSNANLSLTSSVGDVATDYVFVGSGSVGSNGAHTTGGTDGAGRSWGVSWLPGTATSTSMAWSGSVSIHVGATIHPAVMTVSGAVASISDNCTVIAGSCSNTANVLSLYQQYGSAQNAVLNIKNANTTTGIGLQVQGGANTALLVSTANIDTSGSFNYNSANAILKVAADSTGTHRSINAGGSINASGADYAEWIPWSGTKPEAGTIIDFHGSKMVVSSGDTAAFVGNDAISDQANAILVTFTGQVPVKISGTVHAGDYLIPNADGTAHGVAPAAASLADYFAKVGSALEDGSDGKVKALISGPGASDQFNPQAISNFADINVSGALTVNILKVTGVATFQSDIIVGGHIITAGDQPVVQTLTGAGTGATVTIDGNDTTGTITITTGNATAAGDLSKLIFSKAYGKAPRIVFSPANDEAAGLQIFKGTTTVNDLILKAKSAPTANTTYSFDYFIVQ